MSELEALLELLRGEPLSDMFRACGQVFEFGQQLPATNRKGQAITLGEFSLKYICADWRIVQDGKIILGASDRDKDVEFYQLEAAPEAPYDAEAWRRSCDFLAGVTERKFTVESFSLDSFGTVSLQLSHGISIESFASSAQDLDLWFFHNRKTDVSCLVGPSGVYLGGKDSDKSN